MKDYPYDTFVSIIGQRLRRYGQRLHADNPPSFFELPPTGEEIDLFPGSGAHSDGGDEPAATSGEPDQKTVTATSGDESIATSGKTIEEIPVATSGDNPATPIKRISKKKPTAKPMDNVRMFPGMARGGLFGVAKDLIIWRKPKRKTKPGNPKVAADGYEWRKSPTGDAFVLWRRPYLATGKRGKSEYVAHYSRDAVKMLEKKYGSRNSTGSRRLDRRHHSDSDIGAQKTSIG